MAYIVNQGDNSGTGVQTAGSPSIVSGAGGTVSGGSTGGAGTSGPAAAPGGHFASFADYVKSNVPQAQQLAGQLTTQAQQGIQNAQNAVNTTSNAFNQQVTAGTPTFDQTMLSNAASNPAQFASNPDNVTSFQNTLNATYGGPTSYETSSVYNPNTLSDLQTAKTLSAAPTDYSSIMYNTETNPTPGKVSLDAALLQTVPNAGSQFQALAPQAQSVTDQWNNFINSVPSNVANSKTSTATGAANALNTFTGANGVVPTFQSNVNNELTNDTAQANAYNTAINSLIAGQNAYNPYISSLQSAVAAYNADLAAGQQLPAGVGTAHNYSPLVMENVPNSFTPVAAPSINQAATPQDIAEQAALEQLLGNNYTPFFDATGQTAYSAPGAVPTLNSLVNPVVANLQSQAMWPGMQFKGGLTLPPESDASKINDAIKALQAFEATQGA